MYAQPLLLLLAVVLTLYIKNDDLVFLNVNSIAWSASRPVVLSDDEISTNTV